MVYTEESLRAKILEYYASHYPGYIITPRILGRISQIIVDGMQRSPEPMSDLDDKIDKLLSDEMVLSFIEKRQPNITPVPDDVAASIEDYFKGELKGYKLLSVYRKSNHPDDGYMYMVKALKNGGEYACWTSWNQTTGSLNNGHYNLPSDDSCMDILKEQFNDISDNPQKFGMEASKHDFSSEGASVSNEQAAVIPIHRHRSGR